MASGQTDSIFVSTWQCFGQGLQKKNLLSIFINFLSSFDILCLRTLAAVMSSYSSARLSYFPFVASPCLAFPRLCCHAGILWTMLSFGTVAFSVCMYFKVLLDLAALLVQLLLFWDVVASHYFALAGAICRLPPGVFHILCWRPACCLLSFILYLLNSQRLWGHLPYKYFLWPTYSLLHFDGVDIWSWLMLNWV